MRTNSEINRLIAEFMGYDVIEYKGEPIYNGHKYAKTVGEQAELWQGLELMFTGRYCSQVNYPFNSDWRYLIPVITKIENEGFDVIIGKMKCKIINTHEEFMPKYDQEWVSGSAKIELVHHSVIEFITWYNDNN